ncbi:MAG: hypothetical protein ACOZQL_09620 [Myxococcota bacterium]
MQSMWRWRAIILMSSAVVMLPLRHLVPPLTDFGEHAATIATVHDVLFGGPLDAWYELDLLHTQYWLMALVGALLSPLVGGPVAALKLLLVAASVGATAAMLRLLRVLELDERLALAAVALTWTRPMALAFVPFVLALPLVLLVFAEVGGVERPSRAAHVRVALLGLATYLLNLASLMWLGVGAFAVVLARELRRAPAREVLAGVVRRLPGVLVLALPIALWMLTSGVARADPTQFAVSMTPRFWSLPRLLKDGPLWILDCWVDRSGRTLNHVYLGALVLLALPLGAKEPSSGRRAAIALAVATTLLCVALPFERGWLWGLNARFLAAAALLLAPALAFRRGVARSLALAGLGAVSLGAAWNTERLTLVTQQEARGVELLRELRPGSRLLQLSFDQGSAVSHDSVTSHLSGFHRAWNHGPNEPSFVDLPQSVLHYRAGRAPFLRPWPSELSPNEYDNAREGPAYDWVLVRGEGPSFPPAEGTPGPRWELVQSVEGWRLFRRLD